MCGITAAAANGSILDELIHGIRKLEYRGYDSAGIATSTGDGLSVVKQEGEISQMGASLAANCQSGSVGIGHTRWSTHGPPTDANAHPHTDCEDQVAVVHNGIIENYRELREELRERGHEFTSETDTEVVTHLVEDRLDAGDDPETAFRAALDELVGSFAIVMVVAGDDRLFATRRGSPLVVGVDDDQTFLASDVPSFLQYTDRVVFLEDGDVVVAHATDRRITDADGNPVDRPVETVEWDSEDADLGTYDYYMEKEIHEQPAALEQAIQGRIDAENADPVFEELPASCFDDVSRLHFVACGTSFHAAFYARQLLNRRGINAAVTRAGEFASAPPPVDEETLVVGVTQSGETADTLESLRAAADGGAQTLAVTNVLGSTAARECDDAIFIRAGPEIGVAATKTFSSQVATLVLLVERLARDLGGDPHPDVEALFDALERLPGQIEQVLENGTHTRKVAQEYLDQNAYFFVGREQGHPVALEGALKFKEITYEHAEGFAASQLKHGPLALVTRRTPVVAVFCGRHDRKVLNTVHEVHSREAPVIGVSSDDEVASREDVDTVLPIPETHPDLAGILANVQLQLLSYHVARLLGRSIDKPRNLAKSVTVE